MTMKLVTISLTTTTLCVYTLDILQVGEIFDFHERVTEN